LATVVAVLTETRIALAVVSAATEADLFVLAITPELAAVLA